MKSYSALLTGIVGSLLLWAAWPMSPLTFLIFVSWVPMLWVEDHVKKNGRFFAILYLHMLTWNVLTTWWIWNASLPGALGAFIANSLFMSLPWILFRITKRQFGRWMGYGSLIVFWLSFEYLHLQWELSWPWLTLGNVFATHPQWVQWYQYSGTSGGSLWVLLSNVLAYALWTEYRKAGRSNVYYAAAISWIVVLLSPILISRSIIGGERALASADLADAYRNVVVVQPNIDPYEEKFSLEVSDQIQKLITLSEQKIDNNTTLVLWPETAIPALVEESKIKASPYFTPIWSFLHRHSKINLVTGINSYRSYGTKANASSTARFDEKSGTYYDIYNTAASFDADTLVQLYHKAKLVPGVETLPSFLNFIGKWFEDLGGISGTLGRDNQRKVFIPWDNYYKVAPVICYESIYGDYITEYIRKGANVLAILTNDGWWGDTPGYRQHMNYARLRAIETRKWVLRSANTGISCFIDPMGNVIDPQPWNKEAVIRQPVPVNSRLTFFVEHGDLLSGGMLAVAAVLLLWNLVAFIARRVLKVRRKKQATS